MEESHLYCCSRCMPPVQPAALYRASCTCALALSLFYTNINITPPAALSSQLPAPLLACLCLLAYCLPAGMHAATSLPLRTLPVSHSLLSLSTSVPGSLNTFSPASHLSYCSLPMPTTSLLLLYSPSPLLSLSTACQPPASLPPSSPLSLCFSSLLSLLYLYSPSPACHVSPSCLPAHPHRQGHFVRHLESWAFLLGRHGHGTVGVLGIDVIHWYCVCGRHAFLFVTVTRQGSGSDQTVPLHQGRHGMVSLWFVTT